MSREMVFCTDPSKGLWLPEQQPCVAKHTPCPSGYGSWFAWADRMAVTHDQTCCSGCGLWAIWVPKGGDGR